jgi:hypothetical protein
MQFILYIRNATRPSCFLLFNENMDKKRRTRFFARGLCFARRFIRRARRRFSLVAVLKGKKPDGDVISMVLIFRISCFMLRMETDYF